MRRNRYIEINRAKAFLKGQEITVLANEDGVYPSVVSEQIRYTLLRLSNYFELKKRGYDYPCPMTIRNIIPYQHFWLDIISQYENGMTADTFPHNVIGNNHIIHSTPVNKKKQFAMDFLHTLAKFETSTDKLMLIVIKK